MNWYRVKHWSNGRFGGIEIEEFEFVKETPTMVTYREPSSGSAHTDGFRESRQKKQSEDYSWFPDRDAAIADATDRVNNYIANAEARIRDGKRNLEKLLES